MTTSLGEIVYCRSRRYLVEDVVPRHDIGEDGPVRQARPGGHRRQPLASLGSQR